MPDRYIHPPIDSFSPLRFPLGSIEQYFSESPELYMPANKGHMGWDIVRFWGAPVYAMTDGTIEGLDHSEDTSYGNAIYMVSTDHTLWTVYGHLSEQLVKVGDAVKAGQQIGKMGNTGFVVSENIARKFWTKLMLDYNAHPGTHVHINTVPCSPCARANPATGSRILFNGECIQFTYWNNGYGGCVDPSVYFPIQYAFNRPMSLKSTSDDVLYMQFILKKQGMLDRNEDVRGYFGQKTAKALLALQLQEAIAPKEELLFLNGETGGPKTREMLTRLSHQTNA